jgi:hypothetical protein
MDDLHRVFSTCFPSRNFQHTRKRSSECFCDHFTLNLRTYFRAKKGSTDVGTTNEQVKTFFFSFFLGKYLTVRFLLQFIIFLVSSYSHGFLLLCRLYFLHLTVFILSSLSYLPLLLTIALKHPCYEAESIFFSLSQLEIKITDRERFSSKELATSSSVWICLLSLVSLYFV